MKLQFGRQAAVDLHESRELARIGVRDQAVDGPDERALAATRRTGHEDDLARDHGEVQVANGRLGRPAVAKREVLDLEERRAG